VIGDSCVDGRIREFRRVSERSIAQATLSSPATDEERAGAGATGTTSRGSGALRRGRPRRDLAWRSDGHETAEREAATAKPSTVTSPEMSPPVRTASGIIESISITRSAPAAKPSTAAFWFPETLSAIA
jgi:hypothetical protein